MNIVEYKTVSAISSKELDYAVNRQIQLGYQPLGSPYVAGSGSAQALYQALAKFGSGAAEAHRKSEGKTIEFPTAEQRVST
jgi:hypothetical protein